MSYFVEYKGKKYLVDEITDKQGVVTAKLIRYNRHEHRKMVKEIIEKLEPKVNTKVLLREAISKLPAKDIKKFHKKVVIQEKKIKSEKGCYKLTVDNLEICLLG